MSHGVFGQAHAGLAWLHLPLRGRTHGVLVGPACLLLSFAGPAVPQSVATDVPKQPGSVVAVEAGEALDATKKGFGAWLATYSARYSCGLDATYSPKDQQLSCQKSTRQMCCLSFEVRPPPAVSPEPVCLWVRPFEARSNPGDFEAASAAACGPISSRTDFRSKFWRPRVSRPKELK
ncbi:hypothetical protein VUR80DRAFT_6566 [Thermomyces stellatus]